MEFNLPQIIKETKAISKQGLRLQQYIKEHPIKDTSPSFYDYALFTLLLLSITVITLFFIYLNHIAHTLLPPINQFQKCIKI